jgi:hypothetical protein
VAVFGGEPDINMLARQVSLPGSYVQQKALHARRFDADVAHLSQLPFQPPPAMAAVSITVISLLFPGVAVNAKSSMTARFHPSCMMSRRVGDES